MVGVAGFEPAALWSQTRCATKLRYTPMTVPIIASTEEKIKRKKRKSDIIIAKI